jgi:hypothetical protein
LLSVFSTKEAIVFIENRIRRLVLGIIASNRAEESITTLTCEVTMRDVQQPQRS